MDKPFRNARKALGDAKAGIAHHAEPLRQHAQACWNEVSKFVASHGDRFVRGNGSRLSFASITQSRGFQPLFDIGMARDALKARLSTVPVYTVTNKKNEFVLLSSEMTRQVTNGNGRVGLIFMSEKAALELVEQLRKDNPKLGKNTKVMSVGLDAIYDLMVLPPSSYGMEGVMFRLVPDAAEVANALEVFRSAGVPARSVTGVPVFQAEGLSVTAPENKRATPLFLSKTDLDIALKTAGRSKSEKDENDLREKTKMFSAKAKDARNKAHELDGKEARKWTQIADNAEAKAAETQVQLKKMLQSSPKARVEVGSLEDVIERMGSDKSGTWENVLLIRQGVINELRDDQMSTEKKS